MEELMIKDAAKMLGIEAHVLRYWEEELNLTIERNSMGHRIYGKREVELLKNVKALRDRGVGLKEIREGIEKVKKEDTAQKKEAEAQEEKTTELTRVRNTTIKAVPAETKADPDSPNVVDFKVAQLQSVMNKVIANALRENKNILTQTLRAEITEDVMKQMDTILSEKEEREEARFRKLDENLRLMQRVNEEAAATKMKKKRFGRK